MVGEVTEVKVAGVDGFLARPVARWSLFAHWGKWSGLFVLRRSSSYLVLYLRSSKTWEPYTGKTPSPIAILADGPEITQFHFATRPMLIALE